MEKDIIELDDLKNADLTTREKRTVFLLNRIKRVSAKKKLVLMPGYELEVGKEVFFGIDDDPPRVISGVCKGYILTTCFGRYDTESGEVDGNITPIYLGEDGNEYNWDNGGIISPVCDSRLEAEEDLKELIENYD